MISESEFPLYVSTHTRATLTTLTYLINYLGRMKANAVSMLPSEPLYSQEDPNDYSIKMATLL